MLRDHEPIVIEEFNGWWQRGNDEAAPPDHFPQCNNIHFEQSSFRTRDGIGPFEPYNNIVRMFTYVFISGGNSFQSLILLDSAGNFYHDKSPTPWTPILTIAGATDFGMTTFAGRAFITPCNSVTGLQNQKVYVYKGDGTPARITGVSANPVTTTFNVATGGAGGVEAGVHVISVVFETDTGFLSQMGIGFIYTAPGSKNIVVTNIPVSPDPFVIARRLVASKAVDPTLFSGDYKGYQLFFIPGGRIADNTTTTLTISFFDADLLSDASYLLNLLQNIPAGVGLGKYHNRMLIYATFTDISLCYVSAPGQPEAVDAVSGLLVIPLDGTPLTNAQEFRDVLYMFKATRTIAYNDNGDVPSSWSFTWIDEGVGASVHGVATVLDSGGVNIDFLLVVDYSGIMLFNGSFTRPELSWKIHDFWLGLGREGFINIQIYNDSLNQHIFISLPSISTILFGDYANGLDPKNIRWAPLTYNIIPQTITLYKTDLLLIGSAGGVL